MMPAKAFFLAYNAKQYKTYVDSPLSVYEKILKIVCNKEN